MDDYHKVKSMAQEAALGIVRTAVRVNEQDLRMRRGEGLLPEILKKLAEIQDRDAKLIEAQPAD